jgi:hypothetical protein
MLERGPPDASGCWCCRVIGWQMREGKVRKMQFVVGGGRWLQHRETHGAPRTSDLTSVTCEVFSRPANWPSRLLQTGSQAFHL